MAALGALFTPTLTAPAPAEAAGAKAPVITSVAPLKLAVGQTLTLRGRNFVKGRNKNTVVFKRAGGRAVFVKADLATAKLLKVTVPKKLESALLVSGDARRSTRFELRVLGRKLSRATAPALSPVIAPEPTSPALDPPKVAPGTAPVLAIPPAPVPDAAAESGDAPAAPEPCKLDDDLLDEATEKRLELDPCNPDSDADGVEDGYEYRSAMDLNDDEDRSPQNVQPAPEKRPYPNPLFGDAGVDYDGDGLELREEYELWRFTIRQGGPRRLDALSYSDGEQYSVFARGADGHRQPALAAAGYDKQQQFLSWASANGKLRVRLQEVKPALYDSTNPEANAPRTEYDIRDFDRDGDATESALYYDDTLPGVLSDRERDEDADGLTNYQETHSCLVSSYWKQLYDQETAYYIPYAGTDFLDPDSDGDGVRDGADDQDHDDVPNVMECSRVDAGGIPDPIGATVVNANNVNFHAPAFLNPFNPCLPSPKSRTCKRFVPTGGGAWAPFNTEDEYFFVFN